ncbi:hypothetical protein GMMP15_2100008 [Candidatus Magnetomoraceae bacterium gMMP-15]
MDEIVTSDIITKKLSQSVQDVANREFSKGFERIVTNAINKEVAKLKSGEGSDVSLILGRIQTNYDAILKLISLLERESEMLSLSEERYGIYSGMRGRGPVTEFLRKREYLLKELEEKIRTENEKLNALSVELKEKNNKFAEQINSADEKTAWLISSVMRKKERQIATVRGISKNL